MLSGLGEGTVSATGSPESGCTPLSGPASVHVLRALWLLRMPAVLTDDLWMMLGSGGLSRSSPRGAVMDR